MVEAQIRTRLLHKMLHWLCISVVVSKAPETAGINMDRWVIVFYYLERSGWDGLREVRDYHLIVTVQLRHDHMPAQFDCVSVSIGGCSDGGGILISITRIRYRHPAIPRHNKAMNPFSPASIVCHIFSNLMTQVPYGWVRCTPVQRLKDHAVHLQ